MYMHSTNSPSIGRGTRRAVICAAVHGQIAFETNIVFVVDAPFPPSRAFAYAKEEQVDTLQDAHVLDAPMIA